MLVLIGDNLFQVGLHFSIQYTLRYKLNQCARRNSVQVWHFSLSVALAVENI